MKKLLTIAGALVMLLVVAVDLYASQRVVVAEDFTGTWCQYCPAAANGLEQLHDEARDSLLVLAYHYGDPYQTTETYNRIVYYGDMIPGYPTVIFDGLDSMVGSSGSGAAYTNYDYYRPIFDAHKTLSSPFEMAISLVNFDLASLTGTMGVKVRNTNTTTESGTLHFVVMERNIPVIWQGMTEIDYTVRDMIPDENGESISIPAGDSLTLTRNFILDPTWVMGKCQYAAFIQRADKQIIQGAHLYGPCLTQQSHFLTENGDGDGYYEPGESLDLSVWVKNFYSSGTGAEVEAVTSDTFITLTNNLWTIGSMAVGDTLNNTSSPFLIGVKASASMPEGHKVTIHINKKIYSSLYGELVTIADSVSFMVGSPTLAYTEDFENGISDWKVGYTAYTTGVDWDTTQTDFHSPNTCIVNAEFGDYANRQNRWIRMLNYVDLTGYSGATLSWYEKYDVITGDKCQPEVSTDSAGSLWSALISYYSGNVGSWQKRTVDITSFCGNKKYFRIGYRLFTDTINTANGWSVDDIAIDGYLKTGVGGSPLEAVLSHPAAVLYNCVPNPSRGSLSLSYQIPASGRVELGIYDITGRLVKTIINQDQPAGKHQVRWDGRNEKGQNAASGVYFYSLKTGDRTVTKKLVMIK